VPHRSLAVQSTAHANGFVERLQKTILHEHWRIAFRRHYFTGRPMLQRSRDRFLQFYNDERTHRAIVFAGAHPRPSFVGGGRMNTWMDVSTPLRNWTV